MKSVSDFPFNLFKILCHNEFGPKLETKKSQEFQWQ